MQKVSTLNSSLLFTISNPIEVDYHCWTLIDRENHKKNRYKEKSRMWDKFCQSSSKKKIKQLWKKIVCNFHEKTSEIKVPIHIRGGIRERGNWEWEIHEWNLSEIDLIRIYLDMWLQDINQTTRFTLWTSRSFKSLRD